jgi:APA family basic amino acid/polyamine antiporter
VTLAISAVLYIAVGAVAIASVGAETISAATNSQTAPLAIVAREFGLPGIHLLVAAGAITAMLGVLLNLILGLSRVLLAMARRGDLPKALSMLNRTQTTPVFAVLLVGALIASLACIGSVKTTWSFSAFTVLIYYAITNSAALMLPREQRLYSRLYGYGGLMACLILAFWVEAEIWLAGLGLIAVGLVWRVIALQFGRQKRK